MLAFAAYGVITFLNRDFTNLMAFCFTLVGACAAFLWYNAHPAQVFMGDLGSLSLGYLMVGLRHDKRALHDLIAGTRVERVSRASAEAPVAPPPPAETADAPSTASGTV